VTAAAAGRVRQALVSTAGILAAAAAVRVALVLFMPNQVLYGDTLEYEKIARSLLHGEGLGPSPRAPLFPALMALGFRLGGEGNYTAVRLLNVVVGLALVAVAMRLAGRMGGPAARRWTGFALAFSPTLVFTSAMLYPTALYSLVLAALALLALGLAERPTPLRGAGAGLVVALGWLTDPVVIAPLSGVAGWLVLQPSRSRGRLAVALLVAVAVAAAVLVPWARFQRGATHGRVVFMEKAQDVLYLARSDSALAGGRAIRIPPGTPHPALPLGEFLQQEGRLLKEHTGGYLADVTHEFLHFFQPMPDRIQTRNVYSRGTVLLFGALAFLPVLLLAPVGLVAGRAPLRQRLLPAVLILVTAAFYSLFFTQTRYRVPVDSFFTLLAVLGLLRLVPALDPAARRERGNGPRTAA
jgi:4-amino-4-deoxy-L-arabinose transferase-like glycosyltransferase